MPLTLACSLAMAVLLNQNVKLRNFFRTVAFFPAVASLRGGGSGVNMIFNLHGLAINMILNQPLAWRWKTLHPAGSRSR